MLTLDGRVKLGGSGSVMSHKEGAGERKRRRRSLTMSEFPASWLAPESNLSPPTSSTDSNPGSSLPLSMGGEGGSDGVNEMRRQQQYRLPAMPGASAEVDVWALGVSCIELSQGRPPRPETAILASYGDWRFTTTLGNIASIAEASSTATVSSSKSNGWCLPSEAMETVGMGMSEEMWTFIRKCLTPDPEARPTVQELLKDPFIVQHGELSQELLTRIRSMVDFVDQCASISEGLLLGSTGSTTSSSNSLCSLTSSPGSTTTASSTSSSSLTLSPSKATHMIDFKMDEADWLIPRIHPRVDSVYDESSFFDEAGVPKSPPGSSESSCFQPLPVLSDWKHQRISHPKVKQTLMCDQSRYLVFRHSRSPSLATIVEHQMEEDDTIFWTDNDNDKVDDTDDCNSDKDIGTNRNTLDRQGRKEESFQHPGNFHPHYKHGFIQDNQRQGQNNNRDKGDMETVTTEATVHIAHEVVYLDNLTIEYGCGLKSFMEYDLHGASSRLIVLYEIHESCLQ
ncbi:hypothetical protein BGX23_000705 [Mortierella sp. AD031]|nr:hypothetical protein BGX23_000705 [Mortierella sp. AD031]